MKSKDDLLLEQAYDRVNEGIWDRFKGTAAGIGAGLKQGAQNIATNVAGKLGATVTPTGKSGKEAYAQAQQKSIFTSFINKAEKEIKEFEDDVKKLGQAEIMDLVRKYPQITPTISKYKKLLVALKDMQNKTQSIS
jgi:hypothetical protein